MKAVHYFDYGTAEVLQLADIETPVPQANEILVKVHATSVTAADCIMRAGRPAWGRIILGFRRPRKRFRILGSEFSGEVAATGDAVQRFVIGDKVFGFSGFGASAYAQYKTIAEDASVEKMPESIGYGQAAVAVDGATSALFFLRDKGHIEPGQSVLIIGASGSMGSYAVQLAKYFGATVTAVCSTRNVELVKSLGADSVIDYARQKYTDSGECYDMVFDTVGKSSFKEANNSLTADGCYIPTVGLHNSFISRWNRLTGGKRVVTGMSIHKNELLVFIRELIDEGKLRIVVDREYSLDQISDAHAYVDQGHKVGNVIVNIDHDNEN